MCHSGLCNVKEAYTLRSGGFLLGALGCSISVAHGTWPSVLAG